MNNQAFCSFPYCHKKEAQTASWLHFRKWNTKKETFPTGLREGKKMSKSMREGHEGTNKGRSWNTRVCRLSPPPHLKSKEEGQRRGAEERRRGWMGRRAFTDDCSPVWAAKVQTWTSFISLQGHCPWREGSCHSALTSPQWASQLFKTPTEWSRGTLQKPRKESPQSCSKSWSITWCKEGKKVQLCSYHSKGGHDL